MLILCFMLLLTSCDPNNPIRESKNPTETLQIDSHLSINNTVHEVVEHPAFKGFGESLLTRDDNSWYYNTTLDQVGNLMPYHSNVNSGVVINSLNNMVDRLKAGETIFYNYYSEEEKSLDSKKELTGLFYFKGEPGAPFAIICPGGGFSYVGSLHEGFPIAQAISEKGYNAFVIRYRIGSGQWATEDLAQAISFVFDHAEELGLSTRDYSVWGGSAGARMAGNIALKGVRSWGGDNLPKPATAVIAYTGDQTFSRDFSPAFITVAKNDGIASYRAVERRVQNLKNAGVDVEYKRYETAAHGFGLGIGTDAEGWLNLAIQFWERHMNK